VETGFNTENVDYIVDKAAELVDKRNWFRHFLFSRNEKHEQVRQNF
jgi:hypothetical protein